MNNFGFVYKVDFFKEKGDILPHQNMLFLNAEDCHWIFHSKQWAEELVKIEYAMIPIDDPLYMRAKVTSNCLKEMKEKQEEEMPVSER